MNLFLVLFLISILGFFFNRKNIILMLISIEIIRLVITFLILINLFSFDDILSQGFVTIFASILFFISIIIYMIVSFFLQIGLALLYLSDFKFSIGIFIWFILSVIYVLCFYVLSISTFVVLTVSVLSVLCFSVSRILKLNTGIELLTSSTGSIICIGAGCLVYYVVIGMILNLTIAVLALTPTEIPVDVTNGLTGVSTFLTTKSSAFPTSQALLSQHSSIISTPMTCAPSQYLVHDVIIWAVNTGIIGMFEVPSTTPIATVTSTMTDTTTITSTVTSVFTSTIIQPLTNALFGNNMWTGLIYLLTGLGSLTFNFLSSLLCGTNTNVGLACVLNLTLGTQFTQFMSNIGYSYLLSIPPVAVFSILLSIIIGAWTLVIILRPEGSSPIIETLRKIVNLIGNFIRFVKYILYFLFWYRHQ